MTDVVRLDFTAPPPGYTRDERRTGYLRDIYDDLVGPLADAWNHYKARHDPPGVRVIVRPGPKALRLLRIDHDDGDTTLVSAPRDISEASAAAWRWYEARLTLYNILRKINPPREFWPLILTWSDDEQIEVRTFLVKNAAVIMLGGADVLTFPQVLRA